MSCSKWRWTKGCDGQPCPGDCDLCSLDTAYDEIREAEADYLRTWLLLQVKSARTHKPDVMGGQIYRLDNEDIHMNSLEAVQKLAEVAGVDEVKCVDYSERYDKYRFFMDGVEVFCLELKPKKETEVDNIHRSDVRRVADVRIGRGIADDQRKG